MSAHELVFIHNIPFLTDSAGALYYYSGSNTTKEPVHIGSLREGVVTLLDDWKARVKPSLDAWRTSLEPSKRGVPVPRAEKPTRAVRARTGGKSAGAKSPPRSDAGSSVPGASVEGVV